MDMSIYVCIGLNTSERTPSITIRSFEHPVLNMLHVLCINQIKGSTNTLGFMNIILL